jgi:hypothetical protein
LDFGFWILDFGNYSSWLKIAVSARASRGLKRLKSVLARDTRHYKD